MENLTKDELMKLLDDRRIGERARVLFDMLMETLGADFSIKQHEVFALIKEKIEAEQEAILKLTPDGFKTRPQRKKRGVSVSN